MNHSWNEKMYSETKLKNSLYFFLKLLFETWFHFKYSRHLLLQCSFFWHYRRIWESIWGENMHRYGWRQWDREMPREDLESETNVKFLAGISFWRDLFFITVLVDDSPGLLTAGRIHFIHTSVKRQRKERLNRREGEMSISEMRAYHWCLMRWLHIGRRRWFPWLMSHRLCLSGNYFSAHFI